MDTKSLIKEVDEKLREFEKETEPERLREAFGTLDATTPDSDPSRRELFAKWLELANAVDGKLDPKFDPTDLPESKVVPPGGFPPGTDPTKIPDPKLRAEYEASIAAARKKAENYRLQSKLIELDARLTPRLEAYARDNFLMSVEDRKAAIAAVEGGVKSEQRKAALLKLLPLP